MAQFNYEPIRQTAIKLIKQFGRPTACQLVRSVDGAAPDPTKPWRVGDATALTFLFQGVVLPYSVKADSQTDPTAIIFVPGDIIDVKAQEDVSISCGAVIPTDNIVSGNIRYSIEGLHDLTPGAQPIFYKLRCKVWPLDMKTPSTQF